MENTKQKNNNKGIEAMIDDLALMVSKGFQHLEDRLNKRFDRIDQKFEYMEDRLSRLEDKVDHLESQIFDLTNDVAVLHKEVSKLRYDFTGLKTQLGSNHKKFDNRTNLLDKRIVGLEKIVFAK